MDVISHRTFPPQLLAYTIMDDPKVTILTFVVRQATEAYERYIWAWLRSDCDRLVAMTSTIPRARTKVTKRTKPINETIKA